MINTYDTPDFRETIEYKGNYDTNPIKYEFKLFNQIEAMICAELQITIRCQQIFFLMQMLYFFVIHMTYLIVPKQVFISSPLLYIFSFSVLVVQAFQINISPNTVKRFPINLIVFFMNCVARIFVYLYICEFFAISKFLLLNLMALSMIIYIRFKVLQQNFHTYNEVNQIKNSFQLDDTLMNHTEQIQDKDWDKLMSQQEDEIKQEESQEEEESQVSEDRVQDLIKGQKSDIIKQNQSESHQQIDQQKQKNEITTLNNIMDFKVYLYNYVTAIIVPLILWAYFNFPHYQLLKVLIFNVLYLTIMWIHCKTYNSIRRIFVLIYNMENAYLLLTSYFDSDILCPWWLIYELRRLNDKSNQRKTRLSFN